MKKKVLAAVLVAAMTMGLAACGSKSNDSAPADTAEKTEEAADGEETADAEAADGEEKYPEGYTLRVGMNPEETIRMAHRWHRPVCLRIRRTGCTQDLRYLRMEPEDHQNRLGWPDSRRCIR